MLSSLHVYIFRDCFVKNTGTTIPILTAHQTPAFTGWSGIRGLDVDYVDSSSDYFAYLGIPASETTLQQKRMSIADRSHFRGRL
jgi:hypothetical protein